MASQSTSAYSFQAKGLSYALRKQSTVIAALVYRETKTRFGNQRGGFIWAFVEPLIFVSLFLGIRGLIRDRIPFGESALIFMMTGIVTFRVFMGVVNYTMSAVSANRSLLTYPVVKPLDTIFARFLLESTVMIMVAGLVFGIIGYLVEGTFHLNPITMTAAVFALIYLSGAMGCLNAVLSVLMPSYASIYRNTTIMLLLSSGIFYLPSSMPPVVQSIIYWNPLLHCVEWIRGATYLDYISMLDKGYLLGFSTLVWALALGLERRYRIRLFNQ